jgi:hypothetical protein
MTDLRQAAQQALEALQHCCFSDALVIDKDVAADAILAIKQALEQLEQEPTCPECKAAVLYECVACSSNNYPPKPEQEPVLHKWAALFEDPNNDWQAGYESARRWVLEVGLQSIDTPPAAQRPWVGLTNEELEVLFEKYGHKTGVLVGAVQDKLKEKNT